MSLATARVLPLYFASVSPPWKLRHGNVFGCSFHVSSVYSYGHKSRGIAFGVEYLVCKWCIRNCKLMSKLYHYGYVSYSRISRQRSKCYYRKIVLVSFYLIKWCNILVLWVDQQFIAVRFGNYSWRCSLAEQKRRLIFNRFNYDNDVIMFYTYLYT